jgi:predicted Zn-dependent peptidase
MRVVVDEINGAAETINEAEVARAKAQMKAGLLMALESSSARAEQLARQLTPLGPTHSARRTWWEKSKP